MKYSVTAYVPLESLLVSDETIQCLRFTGAPDWVIEPILDNNTRIRQQIKERNKLPALTPVPKGSTI